MSALILLPMAVVAISIFLRGMGLSIDSSLLCV